MTPLQTHRPDIYDVPQTPNGAGDASPAATVTTTCETAHDVAPGSALERLLSFRAQNVYHQSTADVASHKRKQSKSTPSNGTPSESFARCP